MSRVEPGQRVGARVVLAMLGLVGLCLAPSQSAGAAVGGSDASSYSNVAAPTITAPLDGEQVAGYVEVTVTSQAPSVLVVWEPDAHLEDMPYESIRDVTGGVATASLSTSGHAGATEVVVRDCREIPSSSNPGYSTTSCDGAQTSVAVDVSNPSPTFVEDYWLDEWHDDFIVALTEEDDWAWYGFFVDGTFIPPVVDDPMFPMGVSHLGDGEHTLQVARCTESSHALILDPPVCDLANATEVRPFTIRTALHPTTDISPGTISPDGNGIADEAAVTVAVEIEQHVFWSLLQDGEPVARSSGVVRQAGPYTFALDGRDTDGRPLPSGPYTLRIDTFQHPTTDPEMDDRQIEGSASAPILIDNIAPKVRNASATPTVAYPATDGRPDRVRIAGTLSESASRLRIEILRDGAVRRTLKLGAGPAGRFSAVWDGRRPGGRLSVAGRYRYRFVATDRVGNRAVRSGGPIVLRRGAA